VTPPEILESLNHIIGVWRSESPDQQRQHLTDLDALLARLDEIKPKQTPLPSESTSYAAESRSCWMRSTSEPASSLHRPSQPKTATQTGPGKTRPQPRVVKTTSLSQR
jgi:hypothetical protein